MRHRYLSLVLAFALPLTAQEPTPTKPAPAGDALRRALVEATVDRTTIYTAANQLLKGSAEARVQLLTNLAAVSAAAAKTPPAADAKPAELGDDVRALMAEAAVGNAEQSAAALAKLAADTAAGPTALAQLDTRGKQVVDRCLLSFVRAKLATNAVYAGQFAELRDFEPLASATLLAWAKEAPKEATQQGFRGACLRAVRDLLPADKGTDAMRQDLRNIAQQAQHTSDQNLFLTAICALHQFGDPSLFDQVRDGIQKQAEGDAPQQKLMVASTLADLHYQLRQYDKAAEHFRAAIDLLEKDGGNTEGLSTVCYNAACSLALAGKTDDAFAYLEKALQHGQKGRQLSKAMLEEDHDTISLKQDPRYQKLLETYLGSRQPAAK